MRVARLGFAAQGGRRRNWMRGVRLGCLVDVGVRSAQGIVSSREPMYTPRQRTVAQNGKDKN